MHKKTCAEPVANGISPGGRGSKMYAHLLSRGTNSIVDNIVV